jgi:hypothetical protein
MPRKRTPEEQRAYMRDYRERKAAEAADVVAQTPSHPMQSTPAPKPSQRRSTGDTSPGGRTASESKYDCGCRPGDLCIQHGIARMDQKAKDVLLERISKVRDGKADSASLGSFDDALAKARR